MLKKTSLLYIISILTISTIIPAYAARWEDGGMNMGLYFDMDSISDVGNEVTLVTKITNKDLLGLFSFMDEKQRPLSVCLMQATVNCSTGLPTSGAMLCYDKSGNIVIDEVDNDGSNLKNARPMSCEEVRELKNLTK